MKRLFLAGAIAALCTGCAATRPNPEARATPLTEADLAVAGWRVPFQCLELSERIEASQARLYDAVSGMFSTVRATDERRLRSLESRADELGCLVNGSPFTY